MSSGQGTVGIYPDDPNASHSSYGGYQSGGSASVTDLCDQIRSNIYQINNGANTIERALKSIGTERDTPLIRDKIHETSTSTNKTVQATTRLIRSANALRGDRQQKVQIERLTSNFQESISRFQSLQKKATEKVKTAVKLGSQSHAPKLLFDLSDPGETDHQKRQIEDDRVAQLQAQEVVIEDDLDLLHERDERVRQLESDILDVNEIFRDLGAMISEQGGMLSDIEDNVYHADSEIEIGNKQLEKAVHYQRMSRKKKCCLLIIFLVIAIIIIIVVVVTVKK